MRFGDLIRPTVVWLPFQRHHAQWSREGCQIGGGRRVREREAPGTVRGRHRGSLGGMLDREGGRALELEKWHFDEKRSTRETVI